MNKVNKSIGWADCSLNLITGCMNHTNGLCKGGGFPCYAHKLANTRLRWVYLANDNALMVDYAMFASPKQPYKSDPFYPRLWPERFTVKGIPEGSRIFLNDMSDWVGIGIPEEWTRKVLDFIKTNPDYTFLTLTKQPQNLPKFSPFPENCWVGVTATNTEMILQAVNYFYKHGLAKTQFISIEPLLSLKLTSSMFYPMSDSISKKDLDWLIIGSCTGTKTEMSELVQRYPDLTLMPYGKKWTAQPKIEWVQEIVEAAYKAEIPVFEKDNLMPLFEANKAFPDLPVKLRQEFPV